MRGGRGQGGIRRSRGRTAVVAAAASDFASVGDFDVELDDEIRGAFRSAEMDLADTTGREDPAIEAAAAELLSEDDDDDERRRGRRILVVRLGRVQGTDV